ncbi:RRXRR domain-containing protein [Streptomyces sp. NPDC017868]|uniref:RRXRR domain-containing protein n=1 Tax=Streptomyces sp. NPDC017868 TaxID=3365014 RepID=UPI0037BD1C1A
MTTFPAGRKTHQAVLPQQPALESASADTPGSRDETARGHLTETRGTGRGHGRGETDGRGTRARRRHAEQAENRGGDAPQARTGSGSHRVFVLSRDGLPLMPCHPARACALLARGRAVVARHTPFTIRLKNRRRADAEVSGVELRIDPGSRGTGLALTPDRYGFPRLVRPRRKRHQGFASGDLVRATVRKGHWTGVWTGSGLGPQYGPAQRRHAPGAVQRDPREPAPAPAGRRIRVRLARRSRTRRINRLSAPPGVRNV